MDGNNIIIIYSALHTGTWFSCHLLRKASITAHIESDKWFRETYGHVIEDLPITDNINKSWIAKYLKQCNNFPDDVKTIILQAHQRSESNFYDNIIKKKPEIPVVIPLRDPFLSLYSRIWRESKSFKGLKAENSWTREYRIKNQIMSIKRILSIPKTHAEFFPIDIKDSKSIAYDIVKKVNLSTRRSKDYIDKWKYKNSTINLTDSKNKFIVFKELIINKNIKLIRQHLNVELESMTNWIRNDKTSLNKLKDLGYQDLFWW